MSKAVPRRRRRGAKAGNANDVDASKLLEVDQEPAEYEFSIKGASGFDGGKNLKRGDEVTVTVGGRVVEEALVLRRRHESGIGAEEEYLARVVKIKATGGFIRDAHKDETKKEDEK